MSVDNSEKTGFLGNLKSRNPQLLRVSDTFLPVQNLFIKSTVIQYF